MPRIRTIKPEFPQSETMGRVSREARLTFILLWTQADDSGRLRGNSRMLASVLYPYDDDAPKLIGRWLGELDSAGAICCYKADGNSYIEICNWLNHQKIDKPTASKIPPFDESSRSLDESSRSLVVGSKDLRIEGSKDQGPKDQGSLDTRRKRRSPPPSDFSLTDEMREYALKRLPDMDTSATFADFLDYHAAHGTVALDWPAKWRTWINNCVKGFGYARAKRREQTVAATSRKVAPSEVFDRQPNGPGAVHGGVVAGAERDGRRDDPPFGEA